MPSFILLSIISRIAINIFNSHSAATAQGFMTLDASGIAEEDKNLAKVITDAETVRSKSDCKTMAQPVQPVDGLLNRSRGNRHRLLS